MGGGGPLLSLHFLQVPYLIFPLNRIGLCSKFGIVHLVMEADESEDDFGNIPAGDEFFFFKGDPTV
jgi:hypothetical protein